MVSNAKVKLRHRNMSTGLGTMVVAAGAWESGFVGWNGRSHTSEFLEIVRMCSLALPTMQLRAREKNRSNPSVNIGTRGEVFWKKLGA